MAVSGIVGCLCLIFDQQPLQKYSVASGSMTISP
jgi:hypothetical protein